MCFLQNHGCDSILIPMLTSLPYKAIGFGDVQEGDHSWHVRTFRCLILIPMPKNSSLQLIHDLQPLTIQNQPWNSSGLHKSWASWRWDSFMVHGPADVGWHGDSFMFHGPADIGWGRRSEQAKERLKWTRIEGDMIKTILKPNLTISPSILICFWCSWAHF